MPQQRKSMPLVNREISWLGFNARVLQEAADPQVPLIERMRFLGIFSNNRDEFFRTRVATLRRHLKKPVQLDSTYRDPQALLDQIRRVVDQQQQTFNDIYRELLNQLAAHNIHIIDETQLNEAQRSHAREFFDDQVRPFLSCTMLEQARAPLKLNEDDYIFAVELYTQNTEQPIHSLLEVRWGAVPRFIRLPGNEGIYLMFLDDLLRFMLSNVYAGFDCSSIQAYAIKINRDAEVEFEEDSSLSMVERLRTGLRQRRTSAPTRITYDRALPLPLLEKVMHASGLREQENLLSGRRYQQLRDLISFPAPELPELVYAPLPTIAHPLVKDTDTFATMRERDFCLHFPYHSFSTFITLLEQAAIDSRVKAIRITLYRLARNSMVIQSLINAARNGKKVDAIIELQAKFDEERNLETFNTLRNEGVNVWFGLRGFKVHAKMCLITRREDRANRYYLILGTGNFNERTAKLYTDFMLFTTHRKFTEDSLRIFQLLEGNMFARRHRSQLWPAPTHLRSKIMFLINAERRNALAGYEAWVRIKVNALVDRRVVMALYRASQAGVRIELTVRGACSLVPGIPGYSENISAFSTVDRLLEHARVYAFCNNGTPQVYLSSADLMPRNLDARVELLFPVLDADIVRQLLEVLDILFRDRTKSRLHDAGQHNHRPPGKPSRSQILLYDYYRKFLQRGHHKQT